MATTELTGAEEVAWDLTDLYAGIDDPRIESDVAEAETAAAAFRARYHGKVADLYAAGLAEAVAEHERIESAVVRPLTFAHLLFATNMADPARGALVARLGEKAAALETQLLFFVLEWAAAPDDALLHHFGVHVRCLIAIPLLLLAEALVDARWAQVLGHFRASGLVAGEARSGFDRALDRARRLRDSPLVLLALLAFIGLEVIGLVSLGGDDLAHEVLWARGQAEHLGFGGWWYLTISRPVFTLMLGLWLWRGLVALRLLRDLARLPLQLVPTHPDRAGGLGVLAELVSAAAPVTLAISAVIAGRLAHSTAYHGVAVTSLKPVLIVLVAVLALAVVLPLLFFSPRLARVRRQAVFNYSGLLARHGHLVDRRWIKQEDVGKPSLLDAPELGPVADINTMYDAVARMSPMVARPKVLIQAALPPALPIIPPSGETSVPAWNRLLR